MSLAATALRWMRTGNWRQTGEHLSPWRGIWCGTKLNTMHGHGIPSELSHSCMRTRQPLPDQVLGTLLTAVRGSGLGKQDWKPGLAVDIQGAYKACGTRFIDD